MLFCYRCSPRTVPVRCFEEQVVCAFYISGYNAALTVLPMGCFCAGKLDYVQCFSTSPLFFGKIYFAWDNKRRDIHEPMLDKSTLTPAKIFAFHSHVVAIY